jgi:hypothetical protein
METIKEFNIAQVPIWKIVFVATSELDYEMDRAIFVEDYPSYGDYTLISGGHCSCYGFDDTKWDATVYNREELLSVVANWRERGYGSEVIIAPLILGYLK